MFLSYFCELNQQPFEKKIEKWILPLDDPPYYSWLIWPMSPPAAILNKWAQKTTFFMEYHADFKGGVSRDL